jgi:hypothetical protein
MPPPGCHQRLSTKRMTYFGICFLPEEYYFSIAYFYEPGIEHFTAVVS